MVGLNGAPVQLNVGLIRKRENELLMENTQLGIRSQLVHIHELQKTKHALISKLVQILKIPILIIDKKTIIKFGVKIAA